jgi:heme/copper-type cytochrome/quinol oxidase subunit 2
MGGIKDYTFQNIIFVHDFIYIFLIGVFTMILLYFSVVLGVSSVNYRRGGLGYHIEKKFSMVTAYWNKKYIKYSIKPLKLKQHAKPLIYYTKYLTIMLNKVHNLHLEIVWTFIPIVIILELIFPSLSLIADDEISNKASLHTVNVNGNQWYWTYELNLVMGVIKHVSNLVLMDNANIEEMQYGRLLVTTNVVSIPVGLKTSFFITSNDVAHSWAIHGLGIKVDAIPGRINLKTVIPSKLGLYSGMCSELCGIEHGFMPISLNVLSLNKWGYNLEFGNGNISNYYDVRNIWTKGIDENVAELVDDADDLWLI